MIQGKVAIITGASSGIGHATALKLSKAGAKIAIGARRVDKLEELAKQITDNGGEAYFHNDILIYHNVLIKENEY